MINFDRGRFWLGTEDSLIEYLQSVSHFMEMSAKEKRDEKARFMELFAHEDEDEEFPETFFMSDRVGDVGIVNVRGQLINENIPPFIAGILGVTPYPMLRQAMVEQVNNANVSKILMNIDSPGGHASGISATGRFIRDVSENQKPVFSHTEGTMASAAAWIGVQGGEVTAEEMARVGSIGAIQIHQNMVEALNQRGIDVEVFRAGKNKALNNPYEKLSDKAREQIQQDLDYLHGKFIQAIAQGREVSEEVVREQWADGSMFFAPQASGKGLIDRVADFQTVVEDLADQSAGQPETASGYPGIVSSQINKEVPTMYDQKRIQALMSQGYTQAQAKALIDKENNEGSSADNGADEGQGEPQANEGAEGAENEGSEEGADNGGEGQPEASDQPDAGVVDRLLSQVSELHSEKARLQTELNEAQNELSKMKSSHDQLCQIAKDSISRMNVALGGTDAEINLSDGQAIVSMYHQTYEKFSSRFPVGNKANIPVDSDSDAAASEIEEDVPREAVRIR